MHAVDCPLSREYFPAGQSGQMPAPNCEYLPTSQRVQFTDDELLHFPGWHIEQTSDPIVIPSVKYPSRHSRQPFSSCGEGAYFPFSHKIHSLSNVYSPGLQYWHCTREAIEFIPTGQRSQSNAVPAAVANFPFGHSEHAVGNGAPVKFVYEPGSQNLHSRSKGTKYWPATQFTVGNGEGAGVGSKVGS